MRKFVRHPDPDPLSGGGGGLNQNAGAPKEPVTSYHSEDYNTEHHGMSWRDWLNPRARERVRMIENAVAGVVAGSRMIKRIKGMTRRQKVITGTAVLATVAAGATYLVLQRNRRRR